MIYLYWYFGLGLACFAVFFVAGRITSRLDRQKLSESPPTQPGTVGTERSASFAHKLSKLADELRPLIFFITFWPGMLFVAASEWLISRKEPSAAAPRDPDWLDDFEIGGSAHKFEVAPEDLHEQLTVQEIGAREMVSDPLGAVPDLPFGHLNVVWRRFLDDCAETDELWSFSKLWRKTEFRSGYARVRDGKPIAHFVASRKTLEDE